MQTVATMNALPASAAIGAKFPAAKHASRSSVVARGVEPDKTETPETALACEFPSCDCTRYTSLQIVAVRSQCAVPLPVRWTLK